MYNSQYYTCEQIDQRLLQGYLDDYNTQNNTNLTKAEFLTLLFNTIGRNNTVDNLVTQIGYYECDTAGATAAKTITVANYALFAGGSMKVKFINKNTANNATLNINNQGAKALYYQGERASSTNSWDEGEVVEIYYDGTNYYANNVKGGSGSTVLFSELDNFKNATLRDGSTPTRYTVIDNEINRRKMGTLNIISDGFNHVVTQIFTTHQTYDDATGAISVNEHHDDKVVCIYRSIKISGGTLPDTNWTRWNYINDEILKGIEGGLEYMSFKEGVFNISLYNADGDTLATYETLALALAAVPSKYQDGGMNIKFILRTNTGTEDKPVYRDEYVQYRLMKTAWSSAVGDWQGIDDEPIAGSDNLVKSGGVINVIDAVKIGDTQKIQYISNEYIDNTNGKITKYNGWSRTNYLSVEGLTTLSVDNSGSFTAYNCFYDVERKFITRFSIAVGSNSISVPSRARWIIVSQTSSGIDKISFSNLPNIIGLDKKILDLESEVHTVEDEINNADNTPTSESSRLIKSGGVYDYLNYIQGTLYGGYIQSGQWKNVGSSTYKYKIIPIPNASGTIKLKAKEGTGMSADIQCLSTHEPISDSSNGILSNFHTISAGTSRTFTIPAGTNYLYVYWQTSGVDRSPEILEYNGLDLLDGFKDILLGFSKSLEDSKSSINEINETLLKSNDYNIINATLLSNIEKYGIPRGASRVDFSLPVLLTSTINIVCNTGYQISYSLKDAVNLTLYDSNWLNKISLTNKLYDYPTVTRIILYFRKSGSAATSLEDIVANAVSEMSVDYVESSWNEYKKLNLTIINKILYDLYVLSNKEAATSIIDFNSKKEIEPKLGNLGRRYIKYGGSATQYPPVLTFIHMSDVHANNTNILRIKEFFEEYSSYINGGVLDTGDFIGQNLAQGLPSAATEVPYIIRILGNHDAYYYTNSSWVLAPSTDCYNVFFKNYIENWGVVQPTDAEQNGLCYFYKDYSENHIRLICLDGEHLRTGENIDNVQLNWFVNTLADARSNSLHVIVAIHRAPFALTAQPANPFDNLDYVNKSISTYGGDHSPYTEAYTAVKNFIDAGGIFVCWLCGHMHDDYFGLGNSPDTVNQLVIGVACASASTSATVSGTLDRVVGQKSQDCFNIVGIDTTSKTIKIIRIGAEYDRYMRKKNTLSWNYGTNSLIYV